MRSLKEQLLAMASEGIIFNIKRFSVHDGPGIRTSIFFKGCPLNCVWCHNPEGISGEISIWYNRNICIACGECINACPNNALTIDTSRYNYIEIDHILCNVTGDCVRACPTHAIEFTGWRATAGEIMTEIRKDIVFYESSGGGVTLTGGEPLYQADFCLDILKKCRDEKLNTALETCLYCDRSIIESIAVFVDMFLVDIKIFDTSMHEKLTGKRNELILENLRFLSKIHSNIMVRVPLIKGITDLESNIRNIEQFVTRISPGIPVEYLDFNPLTKSKYQKLNVPFNI